MTRSHRLAHYLVRQAALQDRINLLQKKYNLSVQQIQDLARVDPTGEKGAYLEWLVRRVKEENIRWPEDRERVQRALVFFQTNKQNGFLKRNQIPVDINQYTLHDLEDIQDKFSGVDLRSRRQTEQVAKTSGAKVIYDQDPYKVIQIGGPGVDLDQAVQAACLYAKNTKWCTSNPDVAKNQYLKNKPLYVIFEDGVKIAQTDGSQVMNLEDRPIKLSDNLFLFNVLKHVGVISYAEYAYRYAADVFKGRWPQGEKYIQRDPKIAGLYAMSIIKGRWPEAESVIIQDSVSAAKYAGRVLKRRWPQAEPSIMKNPEAAVDYARFFFEYTGWSEAEPYIKQDPRSLSMYANEVLHEVRPDFLPIIAQDGIAAMYLLAEGGIRDEATIHRWPEAEPAIARDAESAAFYAVFVLQHRWPEAEPVIRTDPDAWERYKDNFDINE